MSREKESQKSRSPLLFLILVLMYFHHQSLKFPHHWNLEFRYCRLWRKSDLALLPHTESKVSTSDDF
jgi:hypothetical protein